MVFVRPGHQWGDDFAHYAAFGLNLAAMKIVLILIFAGGLYFLDGLFSDRLPQPWRYALILLVGRKTICRPLAADVMAHQTRVFFHRRPVFEARLPDWHLRVWNVRHSKYRSGHSAGVSDARSTERAAATHYMVLNHDNSMFFSDSVVVFMPFLPTGLRS